MPRAEVRPGQMLRFPAGSFYRGGRQPQFAPSLLKEQVQPGLAQVGWSGGVVPEVSWALGGHANAFLFAPFRGLRAEARAEALKLALKAQFLAEGGFEEPSKKLW